MLAKCLMRVVVSQDNGGNGGISVEGRAFPDETFSTNVRGLALSEHSRLLLGWSIAH